MPETAPVLAPDQVRTLRLAAQGLAFVPGTPPTAVVHECGFVRTLGGTEAYLAVRARQRTLHRAELDGAVDRGELQVVPAVRGCMYLVARADVPLCLRIAEQLSATRNQREHDKAGIAAGEVEELADRVLQALRQGGPLGTDTLRKALPAGAVRSLGASGKKVGISSPLPAALRQLEFAGLIARTPEGGRLDTERYSWRALAKSTFHGTRLPDDPARLAALLLDRFVHFAGVATAAQFVAWSGLPVRTSKDAVRHSRAVTVTLPDGDEALCRPDFTELLRAAPALRSAVAFLPFEDNLVHLYDGPAHLTDPAFHHLQVPVWGRTASGSGRDGTMALGDASHLSLRGLVADGELCGFWEYDPDARVAVPRCFRPPSAAARAAIEELSLSTSAFLRGELGHGRSFSLDTDDELRRRLQQLQALARVAPASSAGKRKGATGARTARPRTATARKAAAKPPKKRPRPTNSR